jgi:hypothetical protein
MVTRPKSAAKIFAARLPGDDSGQAITEYVVMIAVVLSFYLIIARFLTSSGLATKLASPIQQDFARTYQYGKPDVLGFSDPGGPKDHPRIQSTGNFRLFINPAQQ